jgi:dihydrofolate reductase
MIRLIAAVDSNLGIGKNGNQPFFIKRDLDRFRELTPGGNILMGYKTYSIIGHPLSDRHNFVASKDVKLKIPGCQIVSDVTDFLAKEQGDVWVIGGGQIFAAAISQADELYITQVQGDFDCDTFFPNYKDTFYLADESPPMQQDDLKFSFQIWRPKFIV